MIDNIEAIQPRETRQIELSNDKLDMLLFDLLQELIFLKDAERSRWESRPYAPVATERWSSHQIECRCSRVSVKTRQPRLQSWLALRTAKRLQRYGRGGGVGRGRGVGVVLPPGVPVGVADGLPVAVAVAVAVAVGVGVGVGVAPGWQKISIDASGVRPSTS
jgi:hypothetical protein